MFGKKKISKEFIEETNNLISRLHDKIIKFSGGTNGIRDKGGLYHSIHKILLYQEEHSGDAVSIGAFVYEELARRHHFNDGNKRTAHAFAKIMLFLSGYHLKIEYKEAVHFIIEVAKYQSKITFGDIKKWIKKNSIKIEIWKQGIIAVELKSLEKYLNEAILDITEHGN